MMRDLSHQEVRAEVNVVPSIFSLSSLPFVLRASGVFILIGKRTSEGMCLGLFLREIEKIFLSTWLCLSDAWILKSWWELL
jgi:hypothetical protein